MKNSHRRSKVCFVIKRNHHLMVAAFLSLIYVFLEASAVQADLRNPSLIASFNERIGLDRPVGSEFVQSVGRIVNDGIMGKALSLNAGECLQVDVSGLFLKGGTVGFWVRPHWNYYDNNNGRMLSHTFLSMRRSKETYFVVSDGWWENTGGMYFTYFIPDNKWGTHAKKGYIYKSSQWVHIAVTWKEGEDGNGRLYIDGKLVGANEGAVGSGSLSRLYLGCDKGSPLMSGRWADADFDEVVIYDRPLTKNAIVQLIEHQDANWPNTRFAWVEKELSRPQRVPSLQRGNMVESRVIFDEGPAEWQTPERARALIQRIKKAGFNIYVPCVWHGDGTRYSSAFAPDAPYKGVGDPLRTLIDIAHENGIQVHPWVTVAYRSREFLSDYYDASTPPNAFDVFRPQFRDFIVELILEIVDKYEVDGINLDYIRAMGRPSGRYARRLYKQIYNRDLATDKTIFDKTGALEPHLQQFIDSSVEDIVRRVSEGVRKRRPGTIISVDAHPRPKPLRPSYEGRRAIKWANEGLIDVIFAMSYERIPDTDLIRYVDKELEKSAKIIMLIGAFDRNGLNMSSRDPLVLAQLIEVARATPSNGVAIYPYSLLRDEHINALKRGPFRLSAYPNLHNNPKK